MIYVLDITKDQLDIAKRNLTENQQQTFQAKLGNKILAFASSTFFEVLDS